MDEKKFNERSGNQKMEFQFGYLNYILEKVSSLEQTLNQTIDAKERELREMG